MDLGEKLFIAISKLQVNDVFLAKADLECHKHPLLIKPENTVLEMNENVSWRLNKRGDLLFCHVTRTLKGRKDKNELNSESDKSLDSNTESEALISLIVTHFIQYTVNDPERVIDDHTYHVFCQTNAVYNTYPYFREYIHSTCARMGIAPIVLPFLKPITMKEIVERFPVEDPNKKIES
jgi:hypothetical protein